MVKFFKSKATTAGPSSALGITRVFDADSKSPKLSPEFVLGLVIVFIIIIIIAKLIFFR
ncbi:MAG: preprotein translocase subunit Sec61beta [Candidatus ainarchaeum sp.]|nr:preprotein translocase subunit Sec61beta [Candidatus ainarchaeum sp.]